MERVTLKIIGTEITPYSGGVFLGKGEYHSPKVIIRGTTSAFNLMTGEVLMGEEIEMEKILYDKAVLIVLN